MRTRTIDPVWFSLQESTFELPVCNFYTKILNAFFLKLVHWIPRSASHIFWFFIQFKSFIGFCCSIDNFIICFRYIFCSNRSSLELLVFILTAVEKALMLSVAYCSNWIVDKSWTVKILAFSNRGEVWKKFDCLKIIQFIRFDKKKTGCSIFLFVDP